MGQGEKYVFRHRCSDVRLSYGIPGSALLVCKLTPSRADFVVSRLRSQSFGRLREGVSPFSCRPIACGKGCRPWEVRGCRGFLQGRKNPRPPGPRPVYALPSLALQAAGPFTRPDEAGVTFPRCDTLPASLPARRISFITLLL